MTPWLSLFASRLTCYQRARVATLRPVTGEVTYATVAKTYSVTATAAHRGRPKYGTGKGPRCWTGSRR